MPSRVSFFIDGFNLYHSIVDAINARRIRNGKWLNLHQLCASKVSKFDPGGTLESIFYFSAYGKHLPDKGAVPRHSLYLQALKDTGIDITLGEFKKKKPRCKLCNLRYQAYEEKESDVNIAIKMLEMLYADSCDWAVIVSGDTDLSAVVKNGKRIFPKCNIGVLFPYNRQNAEFKTIADATSDLQPQDYATNQFPDPYLTTAGKTIIKPPAW